MIGMCFARAPLRHVEALLSNRQQQTMLILLKDYPGPLPSCAVDPHSSDIRAPLHGLSLDMIPIDELFALEEVLPHILYLPLHGGFSLRMMSNGRVYDEPRILGIL